MPLLAPVERPPAPEIGIHSILNRHDGALTSPIPLRRITIDRIRESAFLLNKESFAELRRRLYATSALRTGWDSHDADPPNANARRLATKLLDLLEALSLPPRSLAPAADGGIAISFIEGSRRAVIEIYNTGEMAAATYSDESEPAVWELDETSASMTAERIRVYLTE